MQLPAVKPGEPTFLVTGGAGFIGSHLVERFIAAGKRVVNLDCLTYAGNLDNLSPLRGEERHIFIRGDIGDVSLVSSILAQYRPALVFNLAAESHVDRSIDDAGRFIDTNVTGVWRLLEASLNYWKTLDAKSQDTFRFVQMSTDEVYGSIGEGKFTEQSSYCPSSPYAASKAAGDHLTGSYRTTFGLPTVIVHASNTYGPRQHPEKFIPHMIISALRGRGLPLYGRGLNSRDWIFVDDLVRGLEAVTDNSEPGEAYNFSGNNEWKNIDVLHELCKELDLIAPGNASHASKIEFVADRPGHDLRYAMANDKVGQLFGWEPQTEFRAGLAATVGWYVEQQNWWKAVIERGYAHARLGARA